MTKVEYRLRSALRKAPYRTWGDQYDDFNENMPESLAESLVEAYEGRSNQLNMLHAEILTEDSMDDDQPVTPPATLTPFTDTQLSTQQPQEQRPHQQQQQQQQPQHQHEQQ